MSNYHIAKFVGRKFRDTDFPKISRIDWETAVDNNKNLIWRDDVPDNRPVFTYVAVPKPIIPKIRAYFISEYEPKGGFYRMHIAYSETAGYIDVTIQTKATLDRINKLLEFAKQLNANLLDSFTKVVDEKYILKKFHKNS